METTTKIINPCKGCPKAGCGVYHDSCPEYQEFRNKKEIEYKMRLKTSERKYDISENSKRHFRAATHYNRKP